MPAERSFAQRALDTALTVLAHFYVIASIWHREVLLFAIIQKQTKFCFCFCTQSDVFFFRRNFGTGAKRAVTIGRIVIEVGRWSIEFRSNAGYYFVGVVGFREFS